MTPRHIHYLILNSSLRGKDVLKFSLYIMAARFRYRFLHYIEERKGPVEKRQNCVNLHEFDGQVNNKRSELEQDKKLSRRNIKI